MSARMRGRFAKDPGAAVPGWLALLCVAALAAAASACTTTSAPAAGAEPAEAAAPPGYVMSGYGTIVRDGYGRCVKSGSWQPESAIRECEPEMFARADAEKAKAEAERRAREEEEARRAQADAERKAREAAAAAAAAKAKEPVWRTVGGDAFFATNEAELNERAKRMLDTMVQRANAAQQAKISIVGHADATGNPQYNMQLSKRRAEAVRTYLEAQGVPGDAIAMDARGQGDPVLDCRNRPKAERAECLQVNRRTQVMLSVLEPRGGA